MKGGLMLRQPVTPSYTLSEVIIFSAESKVSSRPRHTPEDRISFWHVLNGQSRHSWFCLNAFKLSLFLLVFPHYDGSYWNTQKITMARLVLEIQRNKEPQTGWLVNCKWILLAGWSVHCCVEAKGGLSEIIPLLQPSHAFPSKTSPRSQASLYYIEREPGTCPVYWISTLYWKQDSSLRLDYYTWVFSFPFSLFV